MAEIRRRHGESGRTLVIALVALALGTLLVTGFLYFVSTSQKATRAAQQQALDHYSADAGVEDALWRLEHQNNFLQAVKEQTEEGQPYTYTITINGQTVVVTVTTVLTP